MITNSIEIILAIILLTDIVLVASSRLFHCIKITAIQGIAVGLLPLFIWDWSNSTPPLQLWITSIVNAGIKGVLLPILLSKAMRHSSIKRELEPLVSYSASVFIILIIIAASFYFSQFMNAPATDICRFTTPTALSTIGAGLFMIIARKKAITQALGFLMFENGISIFGNGIGIEYGFIIELGILLDVLVLVFIMGITVFNINREFSHIDSDRLNQLGDYDHSKQK